MSLGSAERLNSPQASVDIPNLQKANNGQPNSSERAVGMHACISLGGDLLLVSDIDPSNTLPALPLMPGTSVERAFSLAKRVRDSFEPMGEIIKYNEPNLPTRRSPMGPKDSDPSPDDTGR